MSPHPKAPRYVAVAVLLSLAACGDGAIAHVPTGPTTSDRSVDGSESMVGTAAVPPAKARTIEVGLPPVPVIAVPDLSTHTATGEVVAERLGDLVSPTAGLDVVSATCGSGEDGTSGDLLYQGTTGTDLFAIERDGSGVYLDEGDGELVSLRVDEAGGGEYYQERPDGLTTILTEADGSGEYYRRERTGVVTIAVSGDGAGAYYDDRHDGVLTIERLADGSGRYYRSTADSLLTIDAEADGSGEYYWEPATGPVVTLRVAADGGWVLTTTTSEQLVEVSVDPDGSGRYRQTGRASLDVTFDDDGRSADGGFVVLLPETPAFVVSGAFPALGRLGSLQPPCATVLRFDARLLFEFGVATLREDDPTTAATLDEVVPVLNDTGRPIEIVGHTDAVGGDEANDALSLARARAVEAALVARGLTVPVEVVGMGERQPVAPNETIEGADDPSGRARNRRVEIVIPEPAP